MLSLLSRLRRSNSNPDLSQETGAEASDAAASGRRNNGRTSVLSAMRSLVRSNSDPDLRQETGAKAPDASGDGRRGLERVRSVSLCSFSAPSEETSDLVPGVVGADWGGPGGDGALTEHRGKEVKSTSPKSLRMMMREARTQKLQCEAEGARAVAEAENVQVFKSHIEPAAASLGLKWVNIGLAKPATGTEIHRNKLLADALADKSEFSKDELAAFKVSDLSYSSYIAVGDSYFRPAAPTGLTRHQQRSLRSLTGCPSPQLPRPVLRALARTATSPAQSRGFQRSAASTDGPDSDVVDFSRSTCLAADFRDLPCVVAEELKGRKHDMLHLSMKGVALAAKDGILSGGKSDPYLKFFASRFRKDGSRVSKDGAIREMHMTETIPNDLNPAWQPFSLDLDDLCHGDLDAKFKIECWDEDKLSSNDMIGWIETTVNSLLSEQPLVLNDRPGGKTARPGTLAVTSAHITAGRAYRQWQSRLPTPCTK